MFLRSMFIGMEGLGLARGSRFSGYKSKVLGSRISKV